MKDRYFSLIIFSFTIIVMFSAGELVIWADDPTFSGVGGYEDVIRLDTDCGLYQDANGSWVRDESCIWFTINCYYGEAFQKYENGDVKVAKDFQMYCEDNK